MAIKENDIDLEEEDEGHDDEHDDDKDDADSASGDDDGAGKGKEKSKESDDEDVVIVEDERLVGAAGEKSQGEETQEEKRERRRQEKRDKRDKRLAAERRDKQRIQQLARENEQFKRELNDLKGKVPIFEQRMASQDELQIDQAIQQQSNVYQAALNQLNKAITEGNGASAAEAQRYIDDAREKHGKLTTLKQTIQQQRQQSHTENKKEQSPKIQETDMLKIYRKRWATENDWYDPNGDDEDSQTARAIDKELVREGLDPNRKEFWDTFKDRLKEELPHVYEEKKAKVAPRPRQTNGSVAHDSTAGPSSKLRIPARVVQMARDAGLWDDEKKRKMFIANWKEQNGASV